MRSPNTTYVAPHMTDFPFPADTINHHRFHGLIQGTLVDVEGHIQLKASFGNLRLFPRGGKGGNRAFFAARKNLKAYPDQVVNAYGYPRTTDEGIVDRMEFVSWHTPDQRPTNEGSVSGRFEPGQLYLCGRVRRIEGPLVTVKVKSIINGRDMRWWVTALLAGEAPTIGSKVLFSCGVTADGQLVARPLQEVSPSLIAGNPRRSAGLRGRERTSSSAR